MNSDYLKALYKRQCKYSDYLDELQRSSQRYYFLALGGFVGVLATTFATIYNVDENKVWSTVIDIAEIASILLIIFGFFTLLQLASLRALNFKIDNNIKIIEKNLASTTVIRELFSGPDERTEIYKFGNDWVKACFVAFGNTACICIYLRNVINSNIISVVSFLIIALLFFELNLLFYGFIFLNRLDKEFKIRPVTKYALCFTVSGHILLKSAGKNEE